MATLPMNTLRKTMNTIFFIISTLNAVMNLKWYCETSQDQNCTEVIFV